MFTAKGGSQVSMNTKGWVEVVWSTRIDPEEYVFVAGKMLDLITRMEDKEGRSYMLIDFSLLQDITPEAAALAAKATRDLGCEKIAGFGIAPKFKGVLDTIKVRSTKSDTIREFADRESAEAWLLVRES